MTKYVLKRLVYMVIVFLLVSLLMYSIYNLIPTDPAAEDLWKACENDDRCDNACNKIGDAL